VAAHRRLGEVQAVRRPAEVQRLRDGEEGPQLESADVIVLGLPLYNFAAPSSVKAWVDHLIIPDVTFSMRTGEGLLGDRELLVLSARGGGFGPGTPKEGWDHASAWLGHGLSMTGLRPRFVFADLRWAGVTPATAGLEHVRDASMAAAEAEIDALWSRAATAA
jgi:FMN-dependent NADH-azoreductase